VQAEPSERRLKLLPVERYSVGLVELATALTARGGPQAQAVALLTRIPKEAV